MFDITKFLASYPRFRSVCSNARAREVLAKLAQPASIYKMIIASELGRPALEAMIEQLETDFIGLSPIEKKMFNFQAITVRQAVGSMVQYILLEFGYTKKGSKALKKRPNTIYKTASTYKKTHKETYEIQLSIVRKQ